MYVRAPVCVYVCMYVCVDVCMCMYVRVAQPVDMWSVGMIGLLMFCGSNKHPLRAFRGLRHGQVQGVRGGRVGDGLGGR